MTRQTIQFKAVSEYVAAGHQNTGLCLLEAPVRETDKAVAFEGVGPNQYGYPCKRIAWFPKSQARKVPNDFYTHAQAPAEMWLVPIWLIKAKRSQGCDVLESM